MSKEDDPKLSEITSLNLFPLYGPEFERIQTLNSKGKILKSSLATSEEAYEELRLSVDARINNLELTRRELEDYGLELKSSMAVNSVYLKLAEELLLNGLDPWDFFDFFKLCITINTKYYQAREKESLSHSSEWQLSRSTILTNYNSRLFYQKLDETIPSPPAWFKDNQTKWRAFVANHADAFKYLNPSIRTNYTTLEEARMNLGYMTTEGYPDWTTDLTTCLPDIEVVKNELKSDCLEKQQSETQMENIESQKEQLIDLARIGWAKSAAYLEIQRRNIFPSVNNFSELLLTLNALENFKVRECNIQDILTGNEAAYEKSELLPQQFRERTIRNFAKEGFGFTHPELISLWLEKKLREARFLVSNQELSKDLANYLSMVFNEPDLNPTSLPTELENLRNNQKGEFQVLFYSIRPLNQLLSEKSLSFFKDLLDPNHQSTSEIIKDLSDLISGDLTSDKPPKWNSFLQRTSDSLIKHSISWLNNNWQVAYQELDNILTGKSTRATFKNIQMPPESEGVDLETAQITELNQEIKKGNLADWKILLSLDGKFKETDLIEVEGPNIDDRENKLDEIIRKNRIACSVPPASIIRWFDSRLTVPEEKEWLQWRIFLDDDEYKKVSHGRTRIIYKINKDSKEIRFHVYFKKAWEYRGL